jgi:hypothetical protein
MNRGQNLIAIALTFVSGILIRESLIEFWDHELTCWAPAVPGLLLLDGAVVLATIEGIVE